VARWRGGEVTLPRFSAASLTLSEQIAAEDANAAENPTERDAG
jgi:hypothetical protein